MKDFMDKSEPFIVRHLVTSVTGLLNRLRFKPRQISVPDKQGDTIYLKSTTVQIPLAHAVDAEGALKWKLTVDGEQLLKDTVLTAEATKHVLSPWCDPEETTNVCPIIPMTPVR